MEFTSASTADIPPHFPLITRALLELLAAGELPAVQAVELEPVYGFVGRIRYRDGGIRIVRGRSLDSFNTVSAAALVRDKGWARHFLVRLGYVCPLGERFLCDGFAETLTGKLSWRLDDPSFPGHRTASTAPAWVAEHLRYPIYAKPVKGSGGVGVCRCADETDLRRAIASYHELELEAFVVEEAIAYPDYRVVVYRDDVLLCYERHPITLVGDGNATVGQLLATHLTPSSKRPGYKLDSTDPRILLNVTRAGLTFDSVLAVDERLVVLEATNLSSGGRALDRTADLHPRWRSLCAAAARDMGLVLCGVDLACPDISDPGAPYAILELNGTPGVERLAATSPDGLALARGVYRRVFGDANVSPEPTPALAAD